MLRPPAGATPPRQLALQFLEKAEQVRAAALEAAVGRQLEREMADEEARDREAAALHAALDMQVRAITRLCVEKRGVGWDWQ